jgi:serine/threonine protein kinase
LKYCDNCHSAYPDDFTICPRDQGSLRYASELVPGVVIRGKYEILEKVGTGGMATVYRARHLAFGEIVAIKLVGPKLAHDADFLKRFRTEAVVTRKLQHPNAVRVEDLDNTEDGRPFIVMEFVEGRSLREVIRTEGALPLARAVAIARQVCAALAAAHALGITHRDIKPDNILLTHASDGSDVAKVLDFGIAKVKEGSFDTGEGYTPTQTGMVMGTPQYISPEQAMGKRGNEVDGRSDLYSLGVVLYEMVTGRLPFSSDTAMGMILHHLQTSPTPPQIARADLSIPAPLSDLLMQALQKDRDRRFASADEMLDALDAVTYLPLPAGPTSTAAPEASRLSPLPAPTPAPVERSTPRPALTYVEDIEDRPTRAMPQRQTPARARDVTPVPPLPTAMPPLPRGTPTPVPAPTGPQPLWLLLLLLPLRLAVMPLRLLSRLGSQRPSTGSLPTGVRPSGFPFFLPRLFRHWWFWVIFGLFFSIFGNARRESRRRAEVDRRPSVEAPAVNVPSGEPATPVPDDELQAKVEQALASSKVTREEEIEVEADDGTVTLSGQVGKPLASEVAQALAETVAGVQKVRNRIKVAGPAWPPAEVPDLRGVPFFRPLEPGSPEAKALTELLAKGKQALAREEFEEAMGIYAAALSLDPRNKAAREGLEQAGRKMVRKHAPGPEPPGAPSPPPP